MSELRLGDVIDDYCARCRMITNHAIVSMLGGEPAKVRCRTCYSEHDYRRAQVPVKKDAKKEALFREVLSTIDPAAKQAPSAAEAAPKRAAVASKTRSKKRKP